jgi:hypothetical protein
MADPVHSDDMDVGTEIELSAADREELRKAVLDGLAEAKKFRGVPHEKVREWLLSIESGKPIPRPRGEPIG